MAIGFAKIVFSIVPLSNVQGISQWCSAMKPYSDQRRNNYYFGQVNSKWRPYSIVRPAAFMSSRLHVHVVFSAAVIKIGFTKSSNSAPTRYSEDSSIRMFHQVPS